MRSHRPQGTSPSTPRSRNRRFGVRIWCVGGVLVAISMLHATAFADEIDEGRRQFLRYCASCHGAAADGRGFVSPALAHPPGDLRRLGDGADTALLADRLSRAIDGRKVVTAHGEREMPVWGERFADITSAEGTPRERDVHARINAILAYLLSIQVKARP